MSFDPDRRERERRAFVEKNFRILLRDSLRHGDYEAFVDKLLEITYKSSAPRRDFSIVELLSNSEKQCVVEVDFVVDHENRRVPREIAFWLEINSNVSGLIELHFNAEIDAEDICQTTHTP